MITVKSPAKNEKKREGKRKRGLKGVPPRHAREGTGRPRRREEGRERAFRRPKSSARVKHTQNINIYGSEFRDLGSGRRSLRVDFSAKIKLSIPSYRSRLGC